MNKTHANFYEAFNNIRLGHYGGFGFFSLDTPTHFHTDYYELTFITSGVFTHIYNEQNYTLTTGDFLLMTPYTEHKLYTEPMQATFFAMCIQKDYFQSFIEQFFPNFATLTLPKCSLVHLDKTDLTYLEQLGHQLSIAKPALYVAETLTYILMTNIFYKKNQPSKKKANGVERILTILNNPSNLNISAKQLYATADMAPSVLIKTFKEQTGYTIVEYKNKKKMELAADMLQNSNLKVIDIAAELSFDSLSHFLHSFKKEFGVTPSEYRKSLPPT